MVRIGPSFIAGQGLFATRPLTQGSRIIEYRGEKISKHESARRLARHNNYIFRLNYPTVRPFFP
jgi:SET domain-containing protein